MIYTYLDEAQTIGGIISGTHTVVVEPGHQRWAEFMASSPEPYIPPEPEPPSAEDYRTAVQAHVDSVAVARLYDSGVSLASYVASTNPQWAAEASAFVAWRDAVWAQVYGLWAAPPDPLPTPAEVVAGLPVIEWPEI